MKNKIIKEFILSGEDEKKILSQDASNNWSESMSLDDFSKHLDMLAESANGKK
jgi:hypothetical protein